MAVRHANAQFPLGKRGEIDRINFSFAAGPIQHIFASHLVLVAATIRNT